MLQNKPALPEGYRKDAPLIAECAARACTVCSSAERSLLASGFDYEMETCRNPWFVWRCAACGAAWLDPRPDVAELGVIYPATYYAYGLSETLSPFVVWGKSVLDGRKFSAIAKVPPVAPRSYLDIGCGDGRYLSLMARRGVPADRIFGIDLPSKDLPLLREKGFHVFAGRVEDCEEIGQGSIDLITMFHVIEHIDDPVGVLRRLGSWLSPDGVLALETPNTDSLDARLFRDRWWGGYHFPRHWTFFHAASITRALEKAGLEVTRIEYKPGHSFWLYSFHHMLKYNRLCAMPRLSRLFDPMRSKLFLVLATGFDILRAMLGAKTSAMLVFARRKRGPIQGQQ